jgi:hypothetical protein
MAGLAPAIHAGGRGAATFAWLIREKSADVSAPHRVDARDGRGHDPLREKAKFRQSASPGNG